MKRRCLCVVFLMISVIGVMCVSVHEASAVLVSLSFEELNSGVSLTDQYGTHGVWFRETGSFLSDAPAAIETGGGYVSSQYVLPHYYEQGIYLFFDKPLSFFSTWVYEFPEGGGDGDSVYVRLYETEAGAFKSPYQEEYVIHASDVWKQLSFSPMHTVTGMWMWGTQNFKIDDIAFELSAPIIPEPVSVGCTALGFIAVYMKQRKKK